MQQSRFFGQSELGLKTHYLKELGETFEWAKSRRREYLQSEIQRLSNFIAFWKARQAKHILQLKVDEKIEFAEQLISTKEEMNELEKLTKELKALNSNVERNKISEYEIRQARNYPLWKLLNSKSKHTVICLWHQDRKPSVYLYGDGKGHCFVCNKQIDSIAWIMRRNGINFVQAVRMLNG